MKRNMDAIRQILLTIEAEPGGYAPANLAIEGLSEMEVGFHVHLMVEAGLLDGDDISDIDTDAPQAIPTRITWQGYEFLDAARQPERWLQAKSAMRTVGGVAFGVLVDLLRDMAKKQLGLTP